MQLHSPRAKTCLLRLLNTEWLSNGAVALKGFEIVFNAPTREPKDIGDWGQLRNSCGIYGMGNGPAPLFGLDCK